MRVLNFVGAKSSKHCVGLRRCLTDCMRALCAWSSRDVILRVGYGR